MSTCSNCKARLGCSCQRRVSKSGIACCTNCIHTVDTTKTSVKKKRPSTAPTQVKGVYNGPGRQI